MAHHTSEVRWDRPTLGLAMRARRKQALPRAWNTHSSEGSAPEPHKHWAGIKVTGNESTDLMDHGLDGTALDDTNRVF